MESQVGRPDSRRLLPVGVQIPGEHILGIPGIAPLDDDKVELLTLNLVVGDVPMMEKAVSENVLKDEFFAVGDQTFCRKKAEQSGQTAAALSLLLDLTGDRRELHLSVLAAIEAQELDIEAAGREIERSVLEVALAADLEEPALRITLRAVNP